MELSVRQKLEFIENGYLLVLGVVPPVMVDAALRAINHSLGEGMDPAKVVTFRSQSYCPEVQQAPEIAGLLNDTPAWSLCESLVGVGKIRPSHAGQIALRFPSLADPPPVPRGHLDGMHSPNNGVPYGTIRNFTMLVGVFLSEIAAPYSGNFTVWPGTHRLFETRFREHGPQSLLEGMPKVEMPAPVQLTARPGDVALVHYQVAHGAAVNVSPHVRHAVFFRLTHVDHAERKWATMTDIWLEWDGLRELVAG